MQVKQKWNVTCYCLKCIYHCRTLPYTLAWPQRWRKWPAFDPVSSLIPPLLSPALNFSLKKTFYLINLNQNMHLDIRRGVGGYKDKAWKGYG